MSEAIVCPICETENPADATHCEVCGERLVPAEPGEEVGPEESVAEQLSSDGNEVVGFAVEGDDDEPVDFDPGAAADVTADGMPVFDDDEVDHSASEDADMEALEAELAATADDYDGDDDESDDVEHDEVVDDEEAEEADFDDEEAAEFEDQDEGAEEVDEFEDDDAEEGDEFEDDDAEEGDEFEDDEAGEEGEDEDAEPAFLYSSTDGTAYPKGSPEYEEGFGPMGEELVAEPPEGVEPAEADAGDDEERDDDGSEAAGGFEDDYDEYDEPSEPAEPATREPSPAFKNAFQVREKQRPVMEPLPEPGTLAEPATVTVYMNREPVMRHEIDSDETLIGRKDPVADAYPDVDLTDYDPQAHVSRKHAYIYRQNRNYTIYAVSNAGTQLNSELLELGDRRPLADGDVIIIAGKIAMKFDVPGA